MGNLAWELLTDAGGNVSVLVENAIAPTDAEWRGYVAQVERSMELGSVTALVVTDGGGPNAQQRGQINDVLAGIPVPCAVISDSVLVRGIVTAFNWFNRDIAVFSPSAINQALRFINVQGDRARAVWALVQTLNKRLDPPAQTVGKTESFLKL